MASDARDPRAHDEDPLPAPLPAAGSPVSPVLRLHRALAALDGAAPRTLGVCRAAALRYLESLQRQGVGPGVALRVLRTAAAAWAPARYSAADRLRLDGRLHFWVGTVYRLRSTAPGGEPSPASEA